MKKKLLFSSVLLLGAVTALAGGAMASKAAAPAAAYYAGEEETFRIWVNRGGHYEWEAEWAITVDGAIESPAKPVGYFELYETVADGENNTYLAAFDLPMSVVGKTITLAPYKWVDGVWDTTEYADGVHFDFTYNSGDNAQVYYVGYDHEAEAGVSPWMLTQGNANQKNAPNCLSTKILWNVFAAYYSCSENKDNGYGNFGQVAKTWIVDGELWHGPKELGSIQLDDYASPDDYLAGNKTVKTNVWDKYSTMLANYEEMATPSSAFLGMTGGNFEGAVVALSGLAVVGLGGGALYLAKRRKKA